MVRISPSRAVAIVAALFAASAAAQPAAFEFSFWPGKSVRQDPRFLRMSQHPCGQVAVARVAILPGAKQTGALIAEEVLEINAEGQALRRWRIPVDSYPLAFRGDYLIFQNGPVAYRVDPHGRVSRYPDPKPIPPSSPKNCRGGPDFQGSEFVVCQILTDLVTGQNRRIRFEAPCT